MKLIGDMAKGKKKFDAAKAAVASTISARPPRRSPSCFPKDATATRARRSMRSEGMGPLQGRSP